MRRALDVRECAHVRACVTRAIRQFVHSRCAGDRQGSTVQGTHPRPQSGGDRTGRCVVAPGHYNVPSTKDSLVPEGWGRDVREPCLPGVESNVP
jgi:hypothetical protein